MGESERETERERESERETERETERQRDRERQRQRERKKMDGCPHDDKNKWGKITQKWVKEGRHGIFNEAECNAT